MTSGPVFPAVVAGFLAFGAGSPCLRADDTARLAALLAPGGTVTIPAGDYHLDGSVPIPLRSRTTVRAHGARFLLPETLPPRARIVLFAGQDLAEFAWHGGTFVGHVFDPAQRHNHWRPDANTKGIEITTTRPGGTRDLLFRDVAADGMAGAVIGVHGLGDPRDERAVRAYAERVTLDHCTLLRSGKFMWDYGYLWQILTWPEEHEPWEVERARTEFRLDLVRENLVFTPGDDRIRFPHGAVPPPVSRDAEPRSALSFLGPAPPPPLVRGKQAFVVESGPDFIRIAETPGGPPIRFEADAPPGVALVHDLQAAFWALYAPVGAGPGKGAFDLTGVRDVRVTGCRLSALGDTMHIQRCENIVFADNQILGSRMGAFFLAEYCRNASVTGNLVDGTNGSRVMSVEKSCENVVIVGNTFRNGGRGSWINQPRHFLLAHNVFVDNTTKGEPDPRRGRRSYETGAPRPFPELYFTLHEPDGRYGPALIRDNIFVLGASAPEHAVTFAPNGHDLLMSGNVFSGRPAVIAVDPSCTGVHLGDNPGAAGHRHPVEFHHGRR
jgi:hypothetical protein